MSGPMANGDANDSVWETFRDTIRTLYLVEGHSLEEVISEMTTKYLFTASKTQFELHFKKWDFRKNLTKDEWITLTDKIKKRKRDDKESEVCVYQLPMDPKKVKKAISRYGSTSTMHFQAPSPRTPEGITIRTPLPAPATLPPGRTSPSHVVSTPMRADYPTALVNSLPFMQFKSVVNIEAQLEISKKSANLGPAANPHASSPGSDSATSVAKSADFQASIVDHFQKGADGEDLSNSFSQNLKALVPENVSSSHANLPMTVSQHPSSAAVNFLNLSLFMLSNKFLGPDSDISTKVYHWIKRRSDVGLLEYLLSIGGPTAEALAEQLFSLAIEEDDARTVKKILDSGLDCKELRCSSTRWSTTPLQRACQLRSLEVVRVLLNAGADVNSSPSGPYSPLSCAVNTDQYGQIDSVDIELVQVLLRAGAKVNPSPNESPLLQAAANCHVELVTVLLSAGADPKFSVEDCGDTPLICAVASEGSISDIVSIVRHLLKAGADVHAATDYDNEVLTVLQHALYQSNVGLIQVLLEGGAHITESTLIDAVNARKSNIVKLFLSSGARVTQKVIEVAASNAESEIFWLLLDSVDDGTKESSRSGALTQAICYGKKDLIDALSASGVKLRSTSQLTAAIEAAAARGDISVLRLLLNDDSTYRASAVKSLGCSLSRAIANGRSDITEMLDSHVVWDPLAVDDGNIDDQWFGDWMHMG
ncbi:hypothetical protein MMC21_008440 [Puttea exsequens]|nr:hypothetical protein [Puttea exsequens]